MRSSPLFLPSLLLIALWPLVAVAVPTPVPLPIESLEVPIDVRLPKAASAPEYSSERRQMAEDLLLRLRWSYHGTREERSQLLNEILKARERDLLAARDPVGNTLLHVATNVGVLLPARLSLPLLAKRNAAGETPLHIAAHVCCRDCVRWLRVLETRTPRPVLSQADLRHAIEYAQESECSTRIMRMLEAWSPETGRVLSANQGVNEVLESIDVSSDVSSEAASDIDLDDSEPDSDDDPYNWNSGEINAFGTIRYDTADSRLYVSYD